VVGVVLGVSTAPTELRMVLVEGKAPTESLSTKTTSTFPVTGRRLRARSSGLCHLGTREGATEGGYRLLSSGVACTDHTEAALLRDTLIAHKIENVMLVSAFMPRPRWLRRSVTQSATRAPRCSLSSPIPRPWQWSTPLTGRSLTCRRRLLSDDEDRAVAELVEMFPVPNRLKRP